MPSLGHILGLITVGVGRKAHLLQAAGGGLAQDQLTVHPQHPVQLRQG